MSDSDSEYDDVEIGLTSVLLGFAGKEAIRDDLSVQGNHVGGIPIWYGTQRNPVTPPQDLLTCKICGKRLDLLAQLSCPLPGKNYDRSIYILSCSDPNCRRKEGSIRALRGIDNSPETQERIAKELEASKPENDLVPETKLGDTLFSATSASNPFASALPNVTAPTPTPTPSAPLQPQPTKQKFRNKKNMQAIPGRYVCKVLDVEEEYLDDLDRGSVGQNVKIEEMDLEPEVEQEVKSASNSSSSSDPADPESIKEYESNSDPVFRHFVDIVQSNPEQVLRYELGLRPLLYSSTDEVAKALPQLATKNKKRLEIQLMPHLITELETEDMILDGMEWGTIFVGCDIDDKLPDLGKNGVGYIEEWVGVQWE